MEQDQGWTKERTATLHEVRNALDVVDGDLWDNSSSSYNGVRDRVEVSLAEKSRDYLPCELSKDFGTVRSRQSDRQWTNWGMDQACQRETGRRGFGR